MLGMGSFFLTLFFLARVLNWHFIFLLLIRWPMRHHKHLPSQVEASLNTIEFQLREFNTGSFPRGLSFMLGAMSQWIYGEEKGVVNLVKKNIQRLVKKKSNVKISFTKVSLL